MNASYSYETVPLGLGYGTHYAELYLGNPPQRASVIVDTGSHLTAIPCATCESCGTHTDPPYNYSQSTTSRIIECTEYNHCHSCISNQCFVSQSYSEGSTWQALMIEDQCWLGKLSSSPFTSSNESYGARFIVGCQTIETGLFIGQRANGIMGMSNNENTILNYLYKSKVIKSRVFSLCFGDFGGSMVIGGVNRSLHSSSEQYADLLPSSSGWYAVSILDIQLGNKSLGLSSSAYNTGRGVIVDSGTTETSFTKAALAPFQQLFKEQTGLEYPDKVSKGIDITSSKLETFPSITLVLKGKGKDVVSLVIPPQQYFWKTSENGFSGNFHFDQSSSSGGVLGASFMMNYDVIFDVEKSQVGFARANCGEDKYAKEEEMKPKRNLKLFYIIVLFVLFSLLSIIMMMLLRKSSKGLWSLVDNKDEEQITENDNKLELEEENKVPNIFVINDDEDDSEEELIAIKEVISSEINKDKNSINSKQIEV